MNFKNDHARWVDGEMNESETTEFTHRHGLNPLEAEEWSRTRPWIIKAAAATPKNPDLLDANILQKITSTPLPLHSQPKSLVKLRSLIFAGTGAFALAIFVSFFVPSKVFEIPTAASEVVLLHTTDPSVSVRFFKIPNSRSVAFSLEGATAIPAEVSLK